jgi:hypothetical protein
MRRDPSGPATAVLPDAGRTGPPARTLTRGGTHVEPGQQPVRLEWPKCWYFSRRLGRSNVSRRRRDFPTSSLSVEGTGLQGRWQAQIPLQALALLTAELDEYQRPIGRAALLPRLHEPPEATPRFVILIPIITGQVLHATRTLRAALAPKFRSELPWSLKPHQQTAEGSEANIRRWAKTEKPGDVFTRLSRCSPNPAF